MELTNLKYKLEKLIYINRMFINYGVEIDDKDVALYILEDEIEQLESVYRDVREKLENAN